MIKKPPTAARTIRLTLDHWKKLRFLMDWHGGRAWLEKAIDREHNKLKGK